MHLTIVYSKQFSAFPSLLGTVVKLSFPVFCTAKGFS